MIDYIIFDKEHTHLPKHIKKEKFDLLENFHATFIKFTNIVDCFVNFKLSKKKLLDFMEYTCEHPIPSLELIYPDINFLFFSNTLFGRIFIDNTKSFFKQTNIDGKELLKSFEKREEFKMMKLLRDFGQHFSIPINDLSVSTNFSTNTQNIDIFTSKIEVEKNKETNTENKKFIETIKSDKVALMSYFYSWSSSIDELFDETLNEFYKLIPNEVIISLQKHFNSYIDNRKTTIQILPNAIQKIEQLNKTFISEDGSRYSISKGFDVLRFQRNAIEYLLDKISSEGEI